ncbi:hypothetical protein B0A50_07792 [Salinomyces thailandicus]|uniref:Uncharacterized protein n=1 Tax=Salinomyces thailandicus TaxID=706561 RepID=A0A4V5N395_9PEZI|nr:hypothetical protein B0A50_07792 [Salinomyces thailandica]
MAPSRGLSIALKSTTPYICPSCRQRALTTTPTLLSGHNRWSKIKHDKGRADAAKNKQRSIFAGEISTASKLFGPDPNMNPRLADLITKAKREGFAKASIEAAIARGQGRSLSGLNLESVTVEGILPNNVAVIVECETDSKARTLMEVRSAINKAAGGSITPSSYLFTKRGRIVFEAKEGVDAVEGLNAAVEAGAIDVDQDEEGRLIVITEPADVKHAGASVSKALDLQISTSDIVWEPNDDTSVGLESQDAGQELCAFVDLLREKEAGVQAISMNVARGSLSDDAWNDLQSRLGP